MNIMRSDPDLVFFLSVVGSGNCNWNMLIFPSYTVDAIAGFTGMNYQAQEYMFT